MKEEKSKAAVEMLPRDFIIRRLHSLAGFWLMIYLIMHLFTNSQAALLIGDDGSGFIHSVNSIHELPFLPVIEILVLAIPVLIHAIWGVNYAYRAKYNSFGNTGKEAYLPSYPRNRAYTWQRITSWLLVLGILAHVIHMRFIEYPTSAQLNGQHAYMVRITQDDGLYTLAARLHVQLYDQKEIKQFKSDPSLIQADPLAKGDMVSALLNSLPTLFEKDQVKQKPLQLIEEQQKIQSEEWLKALEKRPLRNGEVIAVADNFGTVELLMLRDTFKMPIMLALYTIFVLSACFHAFNGLFTFMISWGVTLTQRSQRLMSAISIFLMVGITLLGLSAIWLTYWVNLKQ